MLAFAAARRRCLTLLPQGVACAPNFARNNGGKSVAAGVAMTAITTSNSIMMNP